MLLSTHGGCLRMLFADVPRANGYVVCACKCGLERSAGSMAMVQFGLYINSPKGLRSRLQSGMDRR